MLGGDPALDLVNTVSGWESDPEDRLGGPGELADWALAAGLCDARERDRIKRDVRRDPARAAGVYGEIAELRSALRRVFAALARNQRVGGDDLAVIDKASRRAARASELAAVGAGFRRTLKKEVGALERPLFALAQSAERLLVEGPLDRVHFCGGDGCGWMFIDRSKNGKRRWCSMAACGNAAKVKKFRSRRKAALAG